MEFGKPNRRRGKRVCRRGGPQWPCGTCSLNCPSNCLFCSKCEKWFHSQCETLSIFELAHLGELPDEYVCRTCTNVDGHYDYLGALDRLTIASTRGAYSLKTACKLEHVLLRFQDDFTYDDVAVSASGRPTDYVSKIIINKFPLKNNPIPLYVTGDGNCLFNAIVMALTGSERLATELRVRTCIELLAHPDIYKERIAQTDLINVSPDYEEAINDCAKNGGYSSSWCMAAAAKVIKRNIVSVYPSVNTITDQTIEILNTTFECQEPSGEPVNIMWTSSFEPAAELWKPNHFVPLIYGQSIQTSPRSYSEVLRSPPIRSPSIKKARFSTPVSSKVNFTLNTTPIRSCESSPEDMPRKARVNNVSKTIPKTSVSEAAEKIAEILLTGQKTHAPRTHYSLLGLEDETIPATEDNSDHTEADNASPEHIEHTEPEPDNASSEHTEHIEPDNTSPDHTETSSQTEIRLAEGAVPLPMNSFMTTDQLLQLLTQSTSEITYIPRGKKENVYFVLDDTANSERRQHGKRNNFSDDCGVWATKGASSKKAHYRVNEEFTETLERKNNVYCKLVQRKLIPMDPQPDPDSIMILHRFYLSLKRQPQFKRRCSYIHQFPANGDREPVHRHLAIVEYIGEPPAKSTLHGNAKHTRQEYARSKPATIDNMKDKISNGLHPRTIYQQLRKLDDSTDKPRDFKQIQNLKYNLEKTDRGTSEHRANTADDLLYTINNIREHPLIQEIITSKESPPCIILYIPEQIRDIQNFCSTTAKNPSILGVDRTFNLGACYVTTTVFQNTNLYRKSTTTNPIMLGPSYLHWDGRYFTYQRFFSHLKARLSENINGAEIGGGKLVFGSDEERALMKAIRDSFPSSDTVLCVRHLRENVKRHLRDIIGVDEKMKKRIDHMIFGPDGLLTQPDEYEFDKRRFELVTDIEQLVPTFSSYLNKFCDTLRNDVFIPRLTNKWIQPFWTNNACESMNFILKLETNWKVCKIPDLIEKIYDIIKLQYDDIRRSLHGQGNYELAPWSSKFRIQHLNWGSMTTDEKDRAFMKFMKGVPKAEKTVTSTNGQLTIQKTARTAKKPGQKKRVKACRSTTVKPT